VPLAQMLLADSLYGEWTSQSVEHVTALRADETAAAGSEVPW
jgi:hypothetical protein